MKAGQSPAFMVGRLYADEVTHESNIGEDRTLCPQKRVCRLLSKLSR